MRRDDKTELVRVSLKMYVVIFKAKIAKLDEEYSSLAKRLRTLALEEYGCRGVTSVTEGDTEITISYWDSEDQIRAWNENPEHRAAQKLGRSKWYASFEVQIAEVKRMYDSGQ